MIFGLKATSENCFCYFSKVAVWRLTYGRHPVPRLRDCFRQVELVSASNMLTTVILKRVQDDGFKKLQTAT